MLRGGHYTARVSFAFGEHALDYMSLSSILRLIHPLQGMYPTIVILVIAMRRSEAESLVQTHVSQGMRFADPDEITERVRYVESISASVSSSGDRTTAPATRSDAR